MFNRAWLLFFVSICFHFMVTGLDCSQNEEEKVVKYFVVVSDDSSDLTPNSERSRQIATTVKLLEQNSKKMRSNDRDAAFPYPRRRDWVVKPLDSNIEFSTVQSCGEKAARSIKAAIDGYHTEPVTLVLSRGESKEEIDYFVDPQGFLMTAAFTNPAVIFFLESGSQFKAISRNQSEAEWMEKQFACRGTSFCRDVISTSKELAIKMVMTLDLADSEK